jgi:hypothetical protein
LKQQAALFKTVGDGCTTLKQQAALFKTVGDGPETAPLALDKGAGV